MLNEIDLIALGFLLFALWDGWRAGLFRSILSPLCCAFFVIIAIINFDLNYNIAVAGLIVVIGTAVTSVTIRSILWLTRRTVEKQFRAYIFWGSRLLGAGVSVIWKTLIGAVLLLFLTIIPAGFIPGINVLQEKIVFSRTYFCIDKEMLTRFPQVQKIYLVLSVLKDAAQNKEMADNPELTAFFSSPRVQAFMADEGVKSYLAGKNYLQLITHPKLKAIITDDGLMATLTRLSRQIYKEKFKNGEKKQ